MEIRRQFVTEAKVPTPPLLKHSAGHDLETLAFISHPQSRLFRAFKLRFKEVSTECFMSSLFLHFTGTLHHYHFQFRISAALRDLHVSQTVSLCDAHFNRVSAYFPERFS
jgi:hypothetical protein